MVMSISRKNDLLIRIVASIAWVVMLAVSGTARAEESPTATLPHEEAVMPDPTPLAEINYINPDIPEFQPPQYPGRYYQDTVPNTLDLAERAGLAVNFLTETLNPNQDYTLYTTVQLISVPPAMIHMTSDLQCQRKYLEVLPMARMMSGSKQNLDIEFGNMRMCLKMQGDDGLIYSPVSGRPWVCPNNPQNAMPVNDGNIDQVCCLGYGTGRMLSAFCIYAQKDPQGPWREAARKLVDGYHRTAIVDGDNAYIFAEWILPGQKVVKPETKAVGLAGGVIPWIALGLIHYDRTQGNAESAELARKMIQYDLFDMGYFAEDGRFLEDFPKLPQWCHAHTHCMGILAGLYQYEQAGDKKFWDRAVNAFEWYKRHELSKTKIGYFPETVPAPNFERPEHFTIMSEICEVADMIIAAVKLSRHGKDHWDDVDRWLRNQLVEAQFTDISQVTDLQQKGYPELSVPQHHRDYFYGDGQYTTANVVNRGLGGFAGQPSINDKQGYPEKFHTLVNCCSGNGVRAFFHVWRDMLTYKQTRPRMWVGGGESDQGNLRVHLLLNRASKWADIHSYIPYTGRVDVKAKQELDLEIRIPEWVKPADVQCEVEGKARKLSFDGRYAKLGWLKPGEVAKLTFPISERTETVNIQGKQDYTLVIRGNTVVSIDPPGKYLPLYHDRGKYRQGKPGTKNVTRFLSDEEFNWW